MSADCAVSCTSGPVKIELFHYHQPIGHKGFDIESMMNAAGFNTPPVPLAATTMVREIPARGVKIEAPLQ